MGGRRRGHCQDIDCFVLAIMVLMKAVRCRLRSGGWQANEPHVSRDGVLSANHIFNLGFRSGMIRRSQEHRLTRGF